MNESDEKAYLELCEAVSPILKRLGINPSELKSWIKSQDFASWDSWDKEVFAILLNLDPLAIRWLIEERTWPQLLSNHDPTLLCRPISLDRDIPQWDYDDSIKTRHLSTLPLFGSKSKRGIWGDEPILPKPSGKRVYDKDEPPDSSPRGLSLFNIYKQRKDSFSSKTMRSKKLIDQLLVAFVIREAQRGKKEALEILIKCYKKQINKMADNFYNIYQKRIDPATAKEDVRIIAEFLCRKRITGDTKKNIVYALRIPPTKEVRQIYQKLKESRPELWEKLADKSEVFRTEPETIEEWITILNKRIRKLFDKYTGTIDNKKGIYKLGIQHHRIYWARTAALLGLMKGEPRYKVLKGWAFLESMLLDTFSFVLRDPKFNKKRFTPKYGEDPGHRNLTTFLFGKSRIVKDIRSGALWHDLSDWSKHKQVKKQYQVSFDQPISESSDTTYHDFIPATSSDDSSADIVLDQLLEKYRPALTEQEFYILRENRVKKRKQKELAVELGVSQPTVSRLLNKARLKIKTIER